MGLSNIFTLNANFNEISSKFSDEIKNIESDTTLSFSLPTFHVSEFVHKVSINMTETSTVEQQKNKEECMDAVFDLYTYL